MTLHYIDQRRLESTVVTLGTNHYLPVWPGFGLKRIWLIDRNCGPSFDVGGLKTRLG